MARQSFAAAANPFPGMQLQADMGLKKNPGLITVLRETMAKVEQTPGVEADDPSLIELKCILNRRVAALERSMATEYVAPQNCISRETAPCPESPRQEPESSISS